MDEERAHDAAPQPQATVQFSAPRDVMGETMSFSAAAVSGTDVAQPVSTQGIADDDNVPSGTGEPSVITDRPPLRRTRRQRSLELRKKIPDSLILHDKNAIMNDMKGSVTAPERPRTSTLDATLGCFRRLFMNPSYPLRRQMLLTFGSVSSLAILIVMVVSIVAAIATGNAIKGESSEIFEQWVDDIMATTSRHAAEALSSKIIFNDLVELMVEIGQDRFMGYPTTENDSLTPFSDTLNGTNIYPLQNNPLPLDWDFRHTFNERKGNVNATNYAEHVQDRFSWYSGNPRLSTAGSLYTMQGACDPLATNSSSMGYYPNCSEKNNDISTGGVVAPNPTNAQVYRKASDLSPFLKAIYEYHQDIKNIGYFFANSGAGSSVMFPHYELDSNNSYQSIGCEWMRNLNPIDPELGPIGTDAEIARCHPEGANVPTREYNPLERAWCRDQALDPSRIHLVGPYLDAWSKDSWLFTTGKAIYDPLTSIFVACVLNDFTPDGIEEILKEVGVDKLGGLILARNDVDGTVVAVSKYALDKKINTIEDISSKTGVDQEMFNEIKSIVDFSEPWQPEEASGKFATELFESEESIISAYPVPPIPDEYDSAYVPEFFAIFSLPKAEGLGATIGNVSKEVDKNVMGIILVTVIVGVVGLVLVILLLCLLASWFVEPLKWMDKVGDNIVGRFGEDLDASIDYERRKALPCSPKTELSTLVEEFCKMIARFSGEGTAKRMQTNDVEKANLFHFSAEFAGLYQSRSSDDFAFNYPDTAAKFDISDGKSPQQCHLGHNTRPRSKPASASSDAKTTQYDGRAYKSPLFHWMVGLIVSPVLVTTIVISAVVLVQISTNLPSVIVPVREDYLVLRESYRSVATGMLAAKASAVTEKAARDTHLLARFASWLYFGGMGMSGSFADVIEGAEECKTAPNASSCEWGKNQPCDCEWNDFFVRGKKDSCTAYPPGKSRSLQKLHFEAQSQDADSDGSYYSTSFPDVAHSPNTTAWWDNITVLPQSSEEEYPNTRYGTSYDRVQIISALSTVFIPLYNYDKSNDKSMALYIGFESDGMLAGYAGCSSGFREFPFWRSTKDNGAAELRPELCPIGKYGYDARCRGWYDVGRSKTKAGNGTLHITPPYAFATEEYTVGQSITSSLIDPKSKEHIGQVLVDFTPGSIFRALQSNQLRLAEGGFPILITPESDILGHDTVIGPGFSLKDGGKSISDLLLADDSFDPILEEMKAGKKGSGSFSALVGDSREQFNISFAPVIVRSYRPLDSSDITRGVEIETNLVYSLVLGEAEYGIIKSFQSIDDFASQNAKICIGVLSAVIAISTLFIIFMAFRVTSSMAEPILQLLELLKSINGPTSTDDIPQLIKHEGSCREVDSVYNTIEMLYKVVQYANVAFFSGDLKVAYHVLRDALRLFARLDNKKAIAVASNNLGITMLTIYRTMKANGDDKFCGMSKEEVVQKGTAFFAQSIKLGESAYDEFYNKQGWSEECLAFMQFLANRYFNRAIFLLTTSSDHNNQKEAESTGFRDLQITADMDVEIVDQCVEMGFKINRVERYELMMGRVRGLLALVKLGFGPDELFVEDQIVDVYQDLRNAMKDLSHELFKEVSVAGRMQKLDIELMNYFWSAKHDNINAARVAIRMLVEDEYVFLDAEQEAIKVLVMYMNTTDDKNLPEDEDGCITNELRLVIQSLDYVYVQRVQSFLSSSNNFSSAGIMKSLTKSKTHSESVDETSNAESMAHHSSTLSQTFKGDFIMESF